MKIDTKENLSHAILKEHFSKMGWAYREQLVQDVGIDAHVEITDDSHKTVGKLLAIQVKGGPSFFENAQRDAWVFRTTADHRDYWVNHSLPVIIVLVDLDKRIAYFEHLNEKTLISTGKDYKVLVPKGNIVCSDLSAQLANIAEGPEEVQRYRTLALGHSLMQAIADNQDVFLESTEWVNKSSGRGSVTLVLEDATGRTLKKDWSFIAPGWTYEELFEHLVPWATFDVDDDAYYEAALEEHKAAFGTYDKEDDFVYYDHDDFLKSRSLLPKIRPYDTAAGEVAYYRLRLGLNDLGKGFLAVNSFIQGGDPWEVLKKAWNRKFH